MIDGYFLKIVNRIQQLDWNINWIIFVFHIVLYILY